MIKPLFTNKGNYGSQIKLGEKDDDLIEKELNEFFKNAIAILIIKENSFINNSTPEDITDSIDIDNINFTIVFIYYNNI